MTITLHDRYVHADGTPATGSVHYRYATEFFEPSGARTVVGEWRNARLAADGTVTITLDPPAVDHTPAKQYLMLMEDVTCQRSHVFAIPADDLVDGANLWIGAYRTVPEVPVSPDYVPAGQPGPPGPTGPAGSGVTIVGTVPTAADLPGTGTPGDMYIAVDNGHGHTWDGQQWIDVGPIRGPQGVKGPRGPAGQDAQLPAGAPGQILEYQGSSWQASDNLMSTMARVVGAESQINDIVGQTPLPWDPATDYPEFSIVMHAGDLWGALRATNAGEEPGVDPKWVDADLGGLLQRSKHWRVGPPDDPADDGKVLIAGGGDATWQDPPAGYDDTALAGRVTQVETDLAGKADTSTVTTLQSAVTANTQAIAGLSGMPHWSGTQAEYDAIAQPDPGTVYLITA